MARRGPVRENSCSGSTHWLSKLSGISKEDRNAHRSETVNSLFSTMCKNTGSRGRTVPRATSSIGSSRLGRQVERDRVWAKELCEPRVMNTERRIDSSGPQVSVVIPCFNHADFLGETIESAINQTYENIEIVVVDDGSADHTLDVVGQFPTVRYIRQNNQGNAGTYNRSLRECTGLPSGRVCDDELNGSVCTSTSLNPHVRRIE